MAEYKLPDVGEGLTEAEIVTWKVKVGDVIEINDIVVEIETAKSLVELPSPYAGTVTGAARRRGRDGRRSARRSSRSATRRDGSAAPAPGGRCPPSADLEIDLSNPAASGGGEGESLVGRNKADRGPLRRPAQGSASPATAAGAATQMQLQGAFAPGGAQSDDGRRGRRAGRAGHARARRPRAPRRWCRAARRPATSGCWPSRRCASWPRTSASTWPR